MKTRQPISKITPSLTTDRREVEETQRIYDEYMARIREQLKAQIHSGMHGPVGSLSRNKREREIAETEVALKAAYTQLFDHWYDLVAIAEEARASRDA
ncbi:hypothetical protein ROJ8625_03673 [Roseivivax jejudonensis]|uniref:Uncharacterized protein n=1 Tax=Roseivivax jejudonensis TaxID=1529041 RepID=A0A1X7A582_9RHOB|nr:hypothetical protein [Roseivivax jejudonensis]SLN70705.1 hypothetical protein ROJ8625_03673 [Roseivivax jejudonensis]